MLPRYLQRPEGSNWGDFGADDQLGTLNHLDRQARLAAVAEIREGLSFSLSLPLTVPRAPVLNPRRKGPVIQPAEKNGVPVYRYPLARDVPGATDVVSDDRVTLSPQYSTQWAALGHVGAMYDAHGTGQPQPTGYNGFTVSEPVADGFTGTQDLSIAPMARHGIQGRGVLVDLRARFGDAHRKVSYQDLMDVMHADGVQVRPGDILCLHTGWPTWRSPWAMTSRNGSRPVAACWTAPTRSCLPGSGTAASPPSPPTTTRWNCATITWNRAAGRSCRCTNNAFSSWACRSANSGT